MDIKNCINIFLRHCKIEKNLNEKSIKAYTIDLRQFTNFIRIHNLPYSINDIDKNVLKLYFESLSKNYKPKSIKRKIASLKALFNYLEFEETIDVNPFRKVRLHIKQEKRLPQTIRLYEIIDLLTLTYKIKKSILKTDSYQYKTIVRDIAVLELLFATGMRVSEVCNLTKNDVDTITGNIRIFGKGSGERIVQICNNESLQILNEYINLFLFNKTRYFLINRDHQRLSEQSVRLMIKKYVKLTNIERKITPHMFRHTFATMLLEKGVDIRYIQKLLGHSSINTTQIYTHIADKKQREILATKHPREDISVSL